MVFDVSIGMKRENVYLEIIILPICPYTTSTVCFIPMKELHYIIKRDSLNCHFLSF